MDKKPDKLFNEFPPVSAAEWEARIREDLKDVDYDKKLIWRTLEGIRVKPFYTDEDLKNLDYLEQTPGNYPFVRGNKLHSNNWEIRQDFRVFDVESTTKRIQIAAENGITAIGLDFSGKKDISYSDFKVLIHGIDFKKVSLNIIDGDTSPVLMNHLLQAVEELNLNTSDIKGSFCFDPVGHLTCTGGYYKSEHEDFNEMERLLLTVENELPLFRVLPVNSYFLSNAGASVVQELAFGLSIASEYFARFTEQGHIPGEIVAHMQWNLGTGSNYFMELAKIRAARKLFSYIQSTYAGDNQTDTSIFIHSITTGWNKTIYDSYLNILRLTTEAMAAILGGCNSLLIKPYDSWYKEPGDFSERISRNIQIILKEESYFDKVIDPAAGSYYIESLTDSIVQQAWQLFLQVDDKGGYIKAMAGGFIQDEIKNIAARRYQMVSTRKEILLGTNQYPDYNEQVKAVVIPDIAFCEAIVNDNPVVEPIVMNRASVGFEKLRHAVENRKGDRPRVFMLTYGNLTMRLARSHFSGDFFACAGYKIIDNLGFGSVEDGVQAAMKADADIVVVCSSDEEYPEMVPAIKELIYNKVIVVVAGAPACMEDLKQQGVQDFINIRSDVLEKLKQFHQRLGIS
jgi:methylmalonyl-CoA mutase